MNTEPITAHPKPVLIMAGGTGGHVFPALAIAEALKNQGITVYWLGTQRGIEARVVPAAAIPIYYIDIAGVRGKNLVSLLTAPFKMLKAVWQSLRVLRRCQPSVVIGMGGFVTGPGGVAAWLLDFPLLIHEQNAIAGLTNRWLARLASQVMEAFPQTFAKKYHAIHTGNPVRSSILALQSTVKNSQTAGERKTCHLLIVGGSLGAKALNEIVPSALLQLTESIEVRHQTGEAHIAAMQQAYQQARFPVEVLAFIDDMAAAYRWADVVICRAGAMTVAELALAGVASILIPYPHAVDDHQTRNAQFLAEQGAAILLPQSQLTVEYLSNLLKTLLNDTKKIQTMSEAARRCAKPDATQQVIDLCLKWSTHKEHQYGR